MGIEVAPAGVDRGVESTEKPSEKEACKPAPRNNDSVKTSSPEDMIDTGDWEALKNEGNALYVKGDVEDAIQEYGLAIKLLEHLKGDDPTEDGDRKALSILYCNRAQAGSRLVRTATS